MPKNKLSRSGKILSSFPDVSDKMYIKFLWQELLYYILSKKASILLDFLYTLDLFVTIYQFCRLAFVSLYIICSYFIHILISIWQFVNSFGLFYRKYIFHYFYSWLQDRLDDGYLDGCPGLDLGLCGGLVCGWVAAD